MIIEDVLSGHGLNAEGERNYIVTTMKTYKKIIELKQKGKEVIPHEFGVMVACHSDRFSEFENPTPLSHGNNWRLEIIGVYCGGTQNWTHFDMRVNSVWYGDERDYSAGHNDFYSYTGTTKNEVYGTTASNSVMTTDPMCGTVQQWLNNTYGLSLATDGIYGDKTKKALIKGLQYVLNAKFSAKLEVDGIFGKATKAAIKPCKKGTYGAYPSILQAFLICHGYDTGGFDGDYGNRTESAVKTFQTVNGLSATGIADRNTFEKLAA